MPLPVTPMLDVVVWDAIKDSQDAVDFATFLALYPDSPLVTFFPSSRRIGRRGIAR